MTTGFFGGTFDPIHKAHVKIARHLRKALHLDRVLFVPCSIPPHKEQAVISDPFYRFAMVSMALAGEEDFIPSSLELERGEKSYTIDTMTELRDRLGEKEDIVVIIGSDSLAELGTWRSFEELLEMCDFAVAPRPGYPLEQIVPPLSSRIRSRISESAPSGDSRQRAKKIFTPALPLFDVSSSSIREKLHKGEDVSGLLHPSVLEFIKKLSLYQRRK